MRAIWSAIILACWATAACAQDSQDTLLARNGLTPSLLYSGDVATNLSGGAARGTVYTGLLHAQLGADLDAGLGWPGASFFVDGMAVHGGNISGLAGDVQRVSNIAAPPDLIVYEAWFQYNFFNAPVSMLVGRYDVNTEFDTLKSAKVFLNSSFGIEPEFSSSGMLGPSIYPDPSVGLRIAYKPAENVVIRFAALDGVPVDRPHHQWGLFEKGDGVLLVGEIAFLTRTQASEPQTHANIGRLSNLPPYEDKIAIGGWTYTTSLDDLSQRDGFGAPVRRNGSGGVYLIIDKALYRGESDQKLSAFLQLGTGDDRVDRIGAYLGFGVVASGFVPGRASDEMGLGVAIARNGGHFKRQQAAPAATETAIEFTYYAPLTGWLALHPDIQYVIHPDTTSAVANALVFQLQFEISI